MPDNLWCFAWTRESMESGSPPLKTPYLCAPSSLCSTREQAWDAIIHIWFGPFNSTTQRYYRENRRYTRKAAQKYLKRRGGRVIKVKVVPA